MNCVVGASLNCVVGAQAMCWLAWVDYHWLGAHRGTWGHALWRLAPLRYLP